MSAAIETRRAPRETAAPDVAPSLEALRGLYASALQASARGADEPEGFVALVLIEVTPATTSTPIDEGRLAAVTTRLADLLNRRLRSVDVLVRSGSAELAVLLTLAHMGVAAAFSERLRQPIEQAVQGMKVGGQVAVCMGLAANPPASPWHPDLLIELADFRMGVARRLAREGAARDWALVVESAALPPGWAEPVPWPAAQHITKDSGF